MRTTMVAIAFLLGSLLGAVTSAFADARVLTVEEGTPAVAPAPQAEPAPAAPAAEAPQAQPTPPAEPSAPPAAPMEATVPSAAPKEAAVPPAAPPGPPARFSFQPSQNGFVRLDRDTGQVAYCAGRTVGWACEAVPEERAALEKEIARLQDEVAGLKREIAALREPPPPPRPPAELAPRPPAAKDGAKDGDKSGDLTIRLPTQEDIDRATTALQRAWDRVVDMIGNLRNDLTRKSPDRTTL
jgi:hypothetical protein